MKQTRREEGHRGLTRPCGEAGWLWPGVPWGGVPWSPKPLLRMRDLGPAPGEPGLREEPPGLGGTGPSAQRGLHRLGEQSSRGGCPEAAGFCFRFSWRKGCPGRVGAALSQQQTACGRLRLFGFPGICPPPWSLPCVINYHNRCNNVIIINYLSMYINISVSDIHLHIHVCFIG